MHSDIQTDVKTWRLQPCWDTLKLKNDPTIDLGMKKEGLRKKFLVVHY